MEQQATETIIASAASKATLGGAAGSVLGWLASSDAAVISGIVIGIAGLLINLYYQTRRDAREQAEHLLRMSNGGERRKSDRGDE